MRARDGDPLHVAGCMLYWAEGIEGSDNSDRRNSDPAMECLRAFLRECFGDDLGGSDVPPQCLHGQRHEYRARSSPSGWSFLGSHGVQRASMSLNHAPTSSSGKKKNKLPTASAPSRCKRSTRSSSTSTGRFRSTRGSRNQGGSTGLHGNRRRAPQASSSISSSAFWACRRFSAWSKTAERSPVENLGADLLAGMGGQAVQDDRPIRRRREQRVVDPVGRECRALQVRGLVAHAEPDVGVDRVGAGDRLAGVVDQLRAGGIGRARSRAARRRRPRPRRRSRAARASGRRCCRRRRRRPAAPRGTRSAPAASAGRRSPGRGDEGG